MPKLTAHPHTVESTPTTSTSLDRFAQVLGWELGAPLVCLSLIDAQGRLMTSAVGAAPPVALVLSWSFARLVLSTQVPLVVEDATGDPRMARFPVVGDGAVTAYLGARLSAPDGRLVGTLSVMDPNPRVWTARQISFARRTCDRVSTEVGLGAATAAEVRVPDSLQL